MSEAARRRAESCFNLARRATIAGEREAALAQGKRICERHGLSLDDFDVPGRNRPPRAERLIDGGPYGGFTYAFDAGIFDEVLRRMSETLDRSAMVREERARRAYYQVESALNFLRGRGVRCQAAPGLPGFYSVDESLCSREAVLIKAQERGWRG